MDSDHLDRAESVFHAVRDLSPAAREAQLDRRCGGDPELRRFVEELLASYDRGAEGFLRPPDPDTRRVSVAAGPARASGRIGPYRILEVLGEGGMGTVFLAEQEQPVRRKVALKLIKLGMDSRQVVARFEAERQALALMDHPHIAKVFDAGLTADGRPYFVMEYVHGVAITEYCDTHGLSTRRRLELFRTVCEAVQHAHHKGIIHRDLKPSNILVETVDDRPSATIIDFGVAKATGQRLTERTLFTESGMLIGTPEYMSPEQADPAAADVDVRSDIYSLGVVLYELLVGVLPFDRKALLDAGFLGIQRILREVDPPRPSTRLDSTDRDSVAAITKRRSTNPATLSRQLRSELDWIPIKAMAKEPPRRYSSAADLAADIGRYLRNEAILARPPSAIYRARKTVQRHRVPFAFLTLIAFLLTGSSITMAILYAGQKRARERAEVEAGKASEIRDFLVGMIESIDPVETKGREVTVAEVVDHAAETVDEDLSGQAEVLASVHELLGSAYAGLMKHDRAEEQYRLAVHVARDRLGERHEATGRAMYSLARELANRWDREARLEGIRLLEDAISIVGDAKGPRDADIGTYRLLLSIFLWELERRDEATEQLHTTLSIYEENPPGDREAIPVALNILAGRFHGQGDLDSAAFYYERSLEKWTAIGAGDSPGAATVVRNLAVIRQTQGDLAAAEKLMRRALALRINAYGIDVPRTVNARIALASILREAKRFAEAESLLVESVDYYREQAPHPILAWPLAELAELYRDQARPDRAEPLLREALRITEDAAGTTDANVAKAMGLLGNCLVEQENYEEAEDFLLTSARYYRDRDDASLDARRAALQSVVSLYESWGREGDAASWRRELFALPETADGNN